MEFKDVVSIPEIVSIRDSFEYVDSNWHTAEARLRELLTAKYGNEEALCIKTNFLPAYIKTGLVAAKEAKADGMATYESAVELTRMAEFVPRAYCEYNPLYKQIIPYVIAFSPDKRIFMMQRIEGEDRLVGKVSIGIGGHINRIDDVDAGKIIQVAMQRELDEEVDIKTKGSYLKFRAFLYDPTDTVGQDHLGLVFSLHLVDNEISIREVDKLTGSLITLEELATKLDVMENWSSMVCEGLLGIKK